MSHNYLFCVLDNGAICMDQTGTVLPLWSFWCAIPEWRESDNEQTNTFLFTNFVEFLDGSNNADSL